MLAPMTSAANAALPDEIPISLPLFRCTVGSVAVPHMV
jgi:hypothetical protein